MHVIVKTHSSSARVSTERRRRGVTQQRPLMPTSSASDAIALQNGTALVNNDQRTNSASTCQSWFRTTSAVPTT
jgi:hypothetical protein